MSDKIVTDKITTEWKDHFSHSSEEYRRWRPTYPRELYAWLASQAPSTDLACDCATGNGQAAVALAGFFARVVATDASSEQIRQATPHDRVEYMVAPAEKLPVGSTSVDALTVAQALHWFDIDRFHDEARRVLKPRGVIAEWSYGLALIDDAIDQAVRNFSFVTVGPYWPPERAMVEASYEGIAFPFEVINAPAFAIGERWELGRFLAYIGTWSSVSGYRRETGSDPLPALHEELAPLWGDAERDIRWPLKLRAGRA